MAGTRRDYCGIGFLRRRFNNDARLRRIENQIKISDGYREIRSALVSDPELNRILHPNADLARAPVTPAEDRLVRFIVQNLRLAF